VKTDLTTSGSFAQSKALAKDLGKNSSTPKPILGKLPSLESPDYKVELTSKLPGVPTSVPTPSVSVPDLPEVKEKPRPKKLEEIKKPEIKEGSVKRPAIFFLKGLDVFSSPSNSERGYAGLGRIAESIEGSRLYGWDQKDEVIKEIRKIHPDYPVILVGHSLGGDTAIEIADELDSLKQHFRPVDLLVTIDAVGFSHDIIPQNVKQHLNVFGEKSFVLNDGPHVARREEKTVVRNILSPLDHTEIDDDREVQFEIVSLIQKTVRG
jgi:hypothetical protein